MVQLWDLFILSTLLYCFPDAYDLMEKYPEWFQHWNGQLNEIHASVIKNSGKNEINAKNSQHYNLYIMAS